MLPAAIAAGCSQPAQRMVSPALAASSPDWARLRTVRQAAASAVHSMPVAAMTAAAAKPDNPAVIIALAAAA
ncbi:MAG: hypothetical protein COT71_03815 [Candidatus Andersenbacteria bacterium CG10_big_fil_rev_8_21_14_0_10_54_11]|uniref:Uncharacterized protein n=1 Tax=Candidatus Andersenbacteria bacterium CG10_big_fil_rev_8_21_14_0_10_54_11 TaxID=1974485 RepID=A0A2M6WYK9_9BACT|nr:MAG: hypothetical protein COT71_03815 [Candidatus Andersenbacteria bacterium CG10_big_fil_rev_8_21_14_0_10_54_11]